MRPKKYMDGDFVLYTGEESVGMADGGRIGFAEGTMKIRDALQEIVVEKGTNFSSQKELTDLVAEKIGYEPNIKILRPSKYPILSKVTYDSTSKPFTEKELREILGDDYDRFIEEGLSDKKIKERASSRKQFQNMSPEQRQKKLERNRLRIEKLSPQQRALFNERAAIRQQEIRGTKPKYHRVSNAKSLLWNDLIRAAELEDSELSFKNFTPEKGKYYNKAQTENIVLVDRKGNEFKFSSLKDDINKYSGFDAEEVFKPYAQREFLNKQGLTQKLNQAYGFKPGSRQSVFNIQHVQGIAKNPFNVQLTFADQNIAEAGAKRTFDVDFKKATTLSGKKAAVKKFYDNLGADIATQLGKKEVGNRRTLEELLKKTKVPIDDSIMELVRDNPKLQMRVPLLADLFEMAQSIPDDVKKSKYLKAGFKTLGIAATPLVIYDTYKAYEAGQPVLEALEKGFLGTDMLGGTKRILALTPEEREARSVVKQDEMDTQIAQDFAGLDTDFAQPRIKTDLTLEDAQAKAVAGDERVRALEAEKNLQRARARGFRDPDMIDEFLADGGRVNLSVGGITKGAQLVFKTARQISNALLDLKNSVFSNFHDVRFAKTPEETAKGIKKVLEPYVHPAFRKPGEEVLQGISTDKGKTGLN